MGKLKIEYLSLSEIIPYKNNPRKNEKAVNVVTKSINKFDFLVPILIDKNNEIIAGHTRLKAAERAGKTEVPTIRLEDLTEAQAKAFRIMDNKSQDYAEWDNDLLKGEFYSLEDTDFFDSTGFSKDEIIEIWDEHKEVTEDDFTPPKEPKYKIELGDIYQLGEHRLMCGDSTSKDNVDSLMNGQKADMVFTDPPYNVNYSSRGSNKSLGKLDNDNLSMEDFNKFLINFCNSINNILADDCPIYLCHRDTDMNALPFYRIFNEMGWKRSTSIIWAKNVASMGWQDYRNQHEVISYGWKGKKPYFTEKRDKTSLWNIKRDAPQKYEHTTQKPVELSSEAINNSSRVGANVIDLFGGSGSTLMACEQLNRKCYMMELDPYYCSVIIERWEKLTGKTAQKLTK